MPYDASISSMVRLPLLLLPVPFFVFLWFGYVKACLLRVGPQSPWHT